MTTATGPSLCGVRCEYRLGRGRGEVLKFEEHVCPGERMIALAEKCQEAVSQYVLSMMRISPLLKYIEQLSGKSGPFKTYEKTAELPFI